MGATTIDITKGKSVGGEAPSAPFGYSTVLVLLMKWTNIYMTEGKSVGCEAPSAPFGYSTVLVILGKWTQRNGIKVEVARHYNGIVESTADACLPGHFHIKIYV